MEVLGNKFETSIKNAFNSFGEKLKELFIPKTDVFSQIKNELSDRFGIVEQCYTVIKGLFTDITDEAPVFTIELSKGQRLPIIDFTILEPYRPMLFLIQYCIYAFMFANWFIHFIPSMLAGIGAFGTGKGGEK